MKSALISAVAITNAVALKVEETAQDLHEVNCQQYGCPKNEYCDVSEYGYATCREKKKKCQIF